MQKAKKISSNFQSETVKIKGKIFKAGFPHKVIENTINNFNNVDEELVIPRWFFLMIEKQLRLTYLSQTKMDIFSKKVLQEIRVLYKWKNKI